MEYFLILLVLVRCSVSSFRVPTRPKLTAHLLQEEPVLIAQVQWLRPTHIYGQLNSYKLRYGRADTQKIEEKEFNPLEQNYQLSGLDRGARYEFYLSGRNELGWGQEAYTYLDTPEAESKSRPTRSIINLAEMLESGTGRSSLDFISYGNYCGKGGTGQPMDPIDVCCQMHDICYGLAKEGPCQDYGTNSIYRLTYKWKVEDDQTIVCDKEEEHCRLNLCICDVILTNCLKRNIDYYDSEKKKKLSFHTILDGIAAIAL